jgi:hypothetical protein
MSQSQKLTFGDYDKYHKYAKVAREWLGDQMQEKIKAARKAKWKRWKTRSRGRMPDGSFTTNT